jgi:adenylate cyclase
LFTIELLRGLQERGDLVKDREGRWIEGPTLDWETLPARVEAVIAERVGRLAGPERRMLRAASVEGETFTSEVVARVHGVDEREAATRLSEELTRRHRLVRAESIQRIDGQRLSRYRFRHILFQTYLYNSLDEVERIRLHEDVGGGLERLYGDRAEDIALELAHHFEEAGVTGKAVGYLYEAGAQAVRLSANEAAIMHYKRALRLLETLPEVDERLEKELALQLALTAPLEALKGFAAPETARAYARGYELSQQVGPTEQLVPALLSLATFYYARAEGQRSLHLIEQALDVALRKEDPLQVAIARWILAVALLNRGDLERAQVNLEHVIDFYDPRRHAPLVATLAQDLGVSVFAWASWTAWLRGYPDQALERSRQALALAEELGHTYTMGFALTIAGAYFHQLRREVQAAARQNERVVDLSTEERFPLFAAGGTILRGWTSAMEGQAEAGTTAVLQGLEELRAMGVRTMRSRYLAMLAEARARTGQTEAALSTLAEAIAFVEETGERYYEAEIHRLKGELLLREGEEAEAEASFEEAVKVARNQAAKSWELRATVSLCRLWHEQGKLLEARKRLSEVYGWFDEGFDTPDLIEARSLLQDLST